MLMSVTEAAATMKRVRQVASEVMPLIRSEPLKAEMRLQGLIDTVELALGPAVAADFSAYSGAAINQPVNCCEQQRDAMQIGEQWDGQG